MNSYDYDTFISNYQGLGRVGITTDVWFWLTTIMSVIIVQNITLAIIGKCERGRERTGGYEEIWFCVIKKQARRESKHHGLIKRYVS